MLPPFQSRQSVIINASVETVWEFNRDLLRIAEFHPRVSKVDLVSGRRYREEGVSYRCNLADGRNYCVEKDIEIIPMQKIVTVFPEDSLGITKLLPGYVVESTLSKINESTTQVVISHFYSSPGLKLKFFNLFIKPRLARETSRMLLAMKHKIEQGT